MAGSLRIQQGATGAIVPGAGYSTIWVNTDGSVKLTQSDTTVETFKTTTAPADTYVSIPSLTENVTLTEREYIGITPNSNTLYYTFDSRFSQVAESTSMDRFVYNASQGFSGLLPPLNTTVPIPSEVWTNNLGVQMDITISDGFDSANIVFAGLGNADYGGVSGALFLPNDTVDGDGYCTIIQNAMDAAGLQAEIGHFTGWSGGQVVYLKSTTDRNLTITTNVQGTLYAGLPYDFADDDTTSSFTLMRANITKYDWSNPTTFNNAQLTNYFGGLLLQRENI